MRAQFKGTKTKQIHENQETIWQRNQKLVFFFIWMHSQWVEMILILWYSTHEEGFLFFFLEKNLSHFMHQFIRISIFFSKKCEIVEWAYEWRKTVNWLLFQKLASNEYKLGLVNVHWIEKGGRTRRREKSVHDYFVCSSAFIVTNF